MRADGGFRPGARDECGFATVGGIKRFGASESRTPHVNPKPEFVDEVSGVLPGYTGYVPQAKHTHGISHYGNLQGGHHNQTAAGAQKGHSLAKGDRSIEVAKNVKSGYSGHVPVARDTFGAAHYGVGSHGSPDLYKKAPPKRNLQDMRLITGSDAGNSDYASDGGVRTTPVNRLGLVYRHLAPPCDGRPVRVVSQATSLVPATLERTYLTDRPLSFVRVCAQGGVFGAGNHNAATAYHNSALD